MPLKYNKIDSSKVSSDISASYDIIDNTFIEEVDKSSTNKLSVEIGKIKTMVELTNI